MGSNPALPVVWPSVSIRLGKMGSRAESSAHFERVLQERGIDVEWAEMAMVAPARVEDHEDGTRHFLKPIAAFGGRWLRVVINVRANRKVTAFFDRRLSRAGRNR